MLEDKRVEGKKDQEPCKVDQSLYEELGQLTKYVEMMTRTLYEMEAPVTSTSEQNPQAAHHLGELTKVTEEGTHRVIAITEELQENRAKIATLLIELQSSLSQGHATSAQDEQVSRIMKLLVTDDVRLTNITVALSFQDLVAQRVKRLITILEEVEHKLLRLIVLFGIQKEKVKANKEGQGYELLKQLEESRSTALKQDLVDNILSEFGFD